MLTENKYKLFFSRLIFSILISALSVSSLQAQNNIAGERIHEVSQGETLYRIALKYGTTVQAIQKLNQLDSNEIYTGEVLYIPISGKTKTKKTTSQKTKKPSYHIVKKGDTLYRIASKYGMTLNAIAKRNNITNYDTIYMGQKLFLTKSAPSKKQAPKNTTPPKKQSPKKPKSEVAKKTEPPTKKVTQKQAPKKTSEAPLTIPEGWGYYIIEDGDTLYTIAENYQTTPSKLRLVNGEKKTENMKTGDTILVPAVNGFYTESQAGAYEQVNQSIQKDSQDYYNIAYTVTPSDNLASIAKNFDTTAETILDINHFKNPEEIYPGRQILVPIKKK